MKRIILAAIALVVLAAAAPAYADTYTVYAGEQSRHGAPDIATQNRFMPGVVFVHVGDTVNFTTPGGHTVTFAGPVLPRQLAFLQRDPSATYSGVKDSADQLFWFNGLAKWTYNVGIIAPIGSTTIANHAIHSRPVGRDFGAGPSVAFKFTKTGEYSYRCLFHPGMYGKIIVVGAGVHVKTPAEVMARADRQTVAGWDLARKLIAKPTPAKTIVTGPERNGVTLFAFAPQTLHVKVGDVVTFLAGSATEPHNVGFGPKSWIAPFIGANDLFPSGPGSPNQIDPVLIYGSDHTPRTHTTTKHGNGFVAIPAIDRAPGTPLSHVWRIRFTQAGTFNYYCMIHFPFMHGKVIVS